MVKNDMLSQQASALFGNQEIEDRLRRLEAAQKFSSTGGKHRAANLTQKQRTEQASKAAKSRWKKNLQANA